MGDYNRPFPDLTGVEMGLLQACVLLLRAILVPKARLAIENSALRQQVAVFKQSVKRPKLRPRDRDGIYGNYFQKRVKSVGIDEVPIAPRSPWQNPFANASSAPSAESALNHLIVLGESHLKRILADYFEYYHHSRPHLSLDRNAPTPREVEAPSQGEVVSIRQVGGLHHRYSRAA